MKKYFIGIIVILFFFTIIYAHINHSHKKNELLLTQSANGSSGSYWEYSLSTENVIKEKQYYESRNPLNFGPGYKQNWLFEVIGEGEVTIYWIAYEGGNSINQSKSYTLTYNFDKNGKYTIVSSQN